MSERRSMDRPRRPPGGEWSQPVGLGGGWRIQYRKEVGEDFTHYRLVPPPACCSGSVEPMAPVIVALDSLRILPWLQRIFRGGEGPKLFRPVACQEPGSVERARRAVRALDRQATVEVERTSGAPVRRAHATEHRSPPADDRSDRDRRGD